MDITKPITWVYPFLGSEYPTVQLVPWFLFLHKQILRPNFECKQLFVKYKNMSKGVER